MARRKDRVCLAYLAPGEVRMEFADSVFQTYGRYLESDRKVLRALVSLNCGPRVAEGRSQLVDHFAKSGCDWMWMVDSDMTWEPDALDRLLDTAEEKQARIVGGLCFGGRADAPMFPTLYQLSPTDTGWVTHVINDYPRDSVIKVGATGAAFMIVHKSVFRQMKEAFGMMPNGKGEMVPNPYPWFVEASNGGKPFGEDIAFCLKAKALDIDIYVDTSVKVGHIKNRVLNEDAYDLQLSLAERDMKVKTELKLPESA